MGSYDPEYAVDSMEIEIAQHDEDGRFGIAITFCLSNGKRATAIFEEGQEANSMFVGILGAKIELTERIAQRTLLENTPHAN